MAAVSISAPPKFLGTAILSVLLTAIVAGCSPVVEDGPQPNAGSQAAQDVVEPVQEEITVEMWKHLGEVISADPHVPEGGFDSGHLADPKIGRLGDGTYLLTANRAEVPDRGMLVFSSQDLTEWTLVHEVKSDTEWFEDGFPGGFVTLDDGSVRMFFVTSRMAIASATTPDGINWTRDADWRIHKDEFDRDVTIDNLTILPRPEGGWRMYILIEDCTLSNLEGLPHCVSDGGAPPAKETIAYTVVSAVSDDMLDWTLEPGVRFQASLESGNLHHPHAWIAPDGDIRLSSQTGPPPALAKDDWRIAFATLSSQDGLAFGAVEEMSVPIADPFVIKTDDGRYLLFSSPNGDNQFRGIHAFELTTSGWAFDHPQIVDIRFDENGAPEPEVCITVTGRGESNLTFDMRSVLNYWSPDSADASLFEFEPTTLELPGEVRVRILANRGEPNSSPSMLVATDESGVQWWLPFTTTGAPNPGAPCQFD